MTAGLKPHEIVRNALDRLKNGETWWERAPEKPTPKPRKTKVRDDELSVADEPGPAFFGRPPKVSEPVADNKEGSRWEMFIDEDQKID